MNLNFGSISDAVILIGAVCVAVTNIYKFFAKPASKYKEDSEKKEEERIIKVMKKELPKFLEDHDLEVRGRYLQDRYRYLLEIKNAVLEETQDTLKNVERIHLTQSDIINVLV